MQKNNDELPSEGNGAHLAYPSTENILLRVHNENCALKIQMYRKVKELYLKVICR